MLDMLSRTKRAALARAFERSESPESLRTADDVYGVCGALKAAADALGRVDALGFARSPLRAEIDARVARLCDRLDQIEEHGRRATAAHALALAVVGIAAGHPVQPCDGDAVVPLDVAIDAILRGQ